MMRLAADENFDNDILRGLQRRLPDLDIVRIQDTRLYGAKDPDVIDWIAQEGRILLTHDKRTMPGHYYERMAQEENTPGIFLVNDEAPIGQAIDDLVLVIAASDPSEWENQIVFIPLK